MQTHHTDLPQAVGTFGGLLAAILKPLILLAGLPYEGNIINAVIGGTVGYFVTKFWQNLPKWYVKQRFTIGLKNVAKHAKSSIVGAAIVAVCLYFVFTQKATFTEVSPFLLMALPFLGFAPKQQTPLLLVLLVGLGAVACSPKKRLDRLLRNHPELYSRHDTTIIDTVTRATVANDTMFLLKTLRTRDTIILQKDRLTQRFYYNNDTIRIAAECRGDTVYITRNIPIKQIVAPLPRDKLSWWDKWKNWIFGAVGLLAAASIIFDIGIYLKKKFTI